MKKTENLEDIARHIRRELVKISNKANTPHLGSSLSCVEIMVAAYWGVINIDPQNPTDPDRDRLIFSKGHAATTLYIALNKKGILSNETLETYARSGGILPEHPVYRSSPGIEATSGSLGHGLSIGLGIALGARISKRNYRVYVVMSDGECNEGSVWEAAMLAPTKEVGNLAVIIDSNKWQATDRTQDVAGSTSLADKFKAFGWNSYDIDGHNINNLVDTLQQLPDGSGKPLAVVANTVKGKGVSFMEDDNNWHYRIPNQEEVKKALNEIGLS